MKTTIHYKNGQPYTINDLRIDSVEWFIDGDVSIDGSLGVKIEGMVWSQPWGNIMEDILYIEEIDKGCGRVSIHFNPNVEMSVIVDVMTAKQRSKANRSNILSAVGSTKKGLDDSKQALRSDGS